MMNWRDVHNFNVCSRKSLHDHVDGGPITWQLQQSYFEVTRGQIARGSHWRWAVYREMDCQTASLVAEALGQTCR